MPGSMPTKLAQQTIRSINKIALLAYDRPSVQHSSLDVGKLAKIVVGRNKSQHRIELARADLAWIPA